MIRLLRTSAVLLFGTRGKAGRTVTRLLLIYFIGLGTLYASQRALIFRNDAVRLDPAERSVPEMREHVLTAGDGTPLVVWAAPPHDGKPVILYFHGNAGTMGHRSGRFRWMLDRGWGVIALAYRGSGGSGGSPGETELRNDAHTLYDAVPDLLGNAVDSARIVLYGESLGTGIAVTLATERPVGGIILETPYASIEDLAQRTAFLYPVKALGLVRDPFRSIERIDRIDAPLLVMHGTADAVIPFDHAEALFERATHPKWYRWFGGGQHWNLWRIGARETIADFMARYFPDDAA